MASAEVKLKGDIQPKKKRGSSPKYFEAGLIDSQAAAGLRLITFYTELKVALHMNCKSQYFFSSRTKIASISNILSPENSE